MDNLCFLGLVIVFPPMKNAPGENPAFEAREAEVLLSLGSDIIKGIPIKTLQQALSGDEKAKTRASGCVIRSAWDYVERLKGEPVVDAVTDPEVRAIIDRFDQLREEVHQAIASQEWERALVASQAIVVEVIEECSRKYQEMGCPLDLHDLDDFMTRMGLPPVIEKPAFEAREADVLLSLGSDMLNAVPIEILRSIVNGDVDFSKEESIEILIESDWGIPSVFERIAEYEGEVVDAVTDPEIRAIVDRFDQLREEVHQAISVQEWERALVASEAIEREVIDECSRRYEEMGCPVG